MDRISNNSPSAFKPLSGSLRMRVGAGLLLGVMVALWLTTLALMYLMKQEMLSTLAGEQYAVVSLLADDIDRSVNERIRALEEVAATLNAPVMAQAERLDAAIRGQTVLLTLFNWGVLITNRDGTTLVSLPDELGRQGVNYSDVQALRNTLETRRTTVGAALLGKTTRQPVVPMIVPIRDGNGQVTGSLVGLTNLAAPNFLDEIGANRFVPRIGCAKMGAPKWGLIPGWRTKSVFKRTTRPATTKWDAWFTSSKSCKAKSAK